MEARFAEAERILGMSFPEVSHQPDVVILFKVHRFICMLNHDILIATKFAQTFFSQDMKSQQFLYCNADGTVAKLQIKVLPA